MGDPGIGWIAAIIIGGIAGWLAEQFMKSDMGLLMNIVLGIVGAAIASAILSFFGIVLGGWIGYLIAGFIGAVLLIWIVRVIRQRLSDIETMSGEERDCLPCPVQTRTTATGMSDGRAIRSLGRQPARAFNIPPPIDTATRCRLR